MFLTGSSGVKRAACSTCSQIWNHTLCCSHCTCTPEADVWLWQKTREKSRRLQLVTLWRYQISLNSVLSSQLSSFEKTKNTWLLSVWNLFWSLRICSFFFFLMVRLPHQFDCSSCTKAGGMFYMNSVKQSACACCSRMFWIFWKGKPLLFCLTLNWFWKVSRFYDFFGTRRKNFSILHLLFIVNHWVNLTFASFQRWWIKYWTWGWQDGRVNKHLPLFYFISSARAWVQFWEHR